MGLFLRLEEEKKDAKEGCKLARYCNAVCQKAHWKDDSCGHKDNCMDVYDRSPLFGGFTDASTMSICKQMKERAERKVVSGIITR